MKRNISLTLMYDGSSFHGWQMQENAETVQGHLSAALERILGHKVTIYGCSRTDCGVHANIFCCNFRTEKETPCEKIKVGVNALIPESIAVLSAEEKDDDFNARFDCKGKEYVYKVWNSRVRNPFLSGRALHHPIPIDEKLLDAESKAFIGYHDFSAFCASGTEVQDKRRTVFDFSVKREGDLVLFTVKGDGFLYNMVRIIVGTLLEVGTGRISPDEIPLIIESKDREKCGPTAKANGLFLSEVHYSFFESEEV